MSQCWFRSLSSSHWAGADKASHQWQAATMSAGGEVWEKEVLATLSYFSRIFCIVRTVNTPQSSSDYSRQVHIRLGYTVISQLQRKTFAPVWQMCMRSSPATPCTYTELWVLFNLPCLDIHLHTCFFASNLGGRTFKAGTIFLTC